MDYRLALLTGTDIAIPELQLALHQPSLEEISMIGELEFFIGAQCLCINKTLYIEDERLLSQTTNFQIFMTIMTEKSQADKRNATERLLSLLFPSSNSIMFLPSGSLMINQGDQNVIIDENNFEVFQAVLKDVFCLAESGQEAFNPGNEAAKKIADKLMRARQRVAAQKTAENGQGSVFARYLSILSIGLHIPMTELKKYTMYMIYDNVERYMLYTNWDLDIRQRLAGGTPDSSPDD